jgi:hypothetical protein
MRKAFDTVHPDFVRIALQRMGLDDSQAEYYVRLNSAGRIIVRSPYAQHHLAQHGPRLLNHVNVHTRTELTYFTAGRGIGQGDVTSAIVWLLVFDVLLTALDIGSADTLQPTKQRITTCASSGRLQTNNETCFSDDLTSASPNFAIRQRKADIVSAFALIIKLTIAQDKLRSLVQEWGHEPLGTDPGILLTLPNGTLTVPLVPESHTSITSLGIQLDYNNSGLTQFDTTLKYIKNTLGRVRRVRGNPNLKVMVHNIHTVSDAFNRQTHRWSPTIKQLLQAASPLAPLPDLPTSLEPTSIRIGQLWHTHAPCTTTSPYQDAAPTASSSKYAAG